MARRLSARARRFSALITSVLLVGSFTIWAAQPSFAVHDNGMFELDGNVVHNSASTPPYDWASLFGASGNRLITPDPNNGPLLASGFVADTAEPDQSYFTSNKDIQPIASGVQHWGCDPINNPLDKDNLLNAYAALVAVPGNAPDNAGHNVLYLGSERGSNNGTSYAGFWLLKDRTVGCSGSSAFSGRHTDGDILVVSDYTNGGGTQDVSVYRWTGDDASGSPQLLQSYNGGVCGSSSNDSTCAIANSATITTPWSPTSHMSQTFVETGIDLTNLLGANGGCFTTFLAETRSSNQLTATLKDFAAGQFNTCPPAPITTTATPGGTLNPPGTTQHDIASLATVGNRPVPTGSVQFSLCQPNQVTAAGCPQGSGTAVGSPVTVSSGSATSIDVSGATTATPGKYCWGAAYTPDSAGSLNYLPSYHTDASAECFTVVHGSPTISTQIAVTGANAPGLGFTTLGDTATLAGFVGSVSGETVTFKLYGPYATGVTPTCAGAPVFTTTGALNANGVATTSQTYTPTAVGTYVWVASYPGDAFNDAATDSCNQATEKATIVGAQIDVSKSANPPGPVSAGESIGFDITVSNAGAVPATGVQVIDVLPAGPGGVGDLNWGLSPSYQGCAIAVNAQGKQQLTCNLGTVNGGVTLPVIHVTSPTTSVDCGVIQNQASVSTTNGTGGMSDVANVQVNCADVSLVKTADAASVSAGSQIGFTVTASNSAAVGTGTAFGATINDPLPSGTGVDWSIASGPANCSIQGTPPSETLVCTAVNLAPGASESVHVVSGTAYASCGAYPNTATLTGTNFAPLQASATTTVLCPSLHLTKTAAASPVSAGSNISFTIALTNSGPGTATGATITDPLPSGAGIDWSITSGPANCSIQGTPPSETLTCTGVNLAAGATESVTVTSATTFDSCGEYQNEASARAGNFPGPITADASVTVQCAALHLTKTADAATVNAGQAIGFTITASNTGLGTAKTVTIVDPLPTGTGITWTVSPAVPGCSITGGTLTCSVGDLAPKATFSVHITSATTFAGCAEYPNVATLTSSNNPPLQAEASTTVQCPDLTIVKTADKDSVNAGQSIGFTVTVGNSMKQGTGTATDVTLNDPLPAGSGVLWSISPDYAGPGTCSITGSAGSQVLSCAFGDLGLGAAASVHVTSATQFASCAAYPNTAAAQADNHPKITASATTSVLCPALSITKTADADTVDAGDPIGFTISVSNAGAEGTGVAKGVTIDDLLPSGTDVSWSIGTGPDNCSIEGSAPSQQLVCTAVDLAPGQSEMVHVVSNTTFDSCGRYDNTAKMSALNAPDGTATASTTVVCSHLSLSKQADSETAVTAGDPIGFTITVTNADTETTGTAKDVVVTDPLPGPDGSGVVWSLDQGYDGPCTISGNPGSQVLTCPLGNLEPGAQVTVHVSSPTQFASCGTYKNTASLTADNAPGKTANASTTVDCPALAITKTADADTVQSGKKIGFTITAGNTGDVPAVGAVINDPLPAGADVDWSIDPAYSGPGTCAIEGAVGSQVLACALGDLAPGGTASVHIVSGTTDNSCQIYANTATLGADNAPALTAKARTDVLCVAPTVVTRTPTPTPTPTPAKSPLAVTGAGPVTAEVFGALALIVGGAFLTLVATRRRREH